MGSVQAEPYEFEFDPRTCALMIIDMQRDFVDPGGFGEALGNDVSLLRKAIAPTKTVLDAARKVGMLVVHTREGHRQDLSDLPQNKKLRGKLKAGIGDPGPMGRILVRGEYGHDIVDELKPLPGEPITAVSPSVISICDCAFLVKMVGSPRAPVLTKSASFFWTWTSSKTEPSLVT